MRRHLVGISAGVFALIVGLVIYAYGLFYVGKAQAHFDLIRGKYRLKVLGESSDKFREIMSKEYGVEFIDVSIPENGEELVSYEDVSCRPCQMANGYNEAMLESLDKRYGHYVLERAWELVEQDSKKQQSLEVQE